MKRLARLDTTAHFGGEAYSKEELVAEIGSAALALSGPVGWCFLGGAAVGAAALGVAGGMD